jgi:CRISPR-associated protein Cmr1
VHSRFLARQNGNASTFNKVTGRKELNKQAQQLVDKTDIAKWLAGKQQESKKVFSFKDPARTFGFVKPGTIDFDGMKERLRGAWQNLADEEVLTDNEIINRLFNDTTPAAE